MSDEKPEMVDQVNGSPPTREQVVAAYQHALHAYSVGLAQKVQQAGGELNPLDLLVQGNIIAMRLNTLLNYLQECSAAGTQFTMIEYDCRVVANLQQMAAAMAQPQILVASGPPRRQ